MAQGKRNPKVDAYLKKAAKWQREMRRLREIILTCPVTEELKWDKPCYSFEGSNLVVLLPLKDYCTVLFCKGALLKDPHGVLIQTTKNTQAARHFRFTENGEIARAKSVLTTYIHEAIAAEKRGLKVVYKDTADYPVPEEFKKELERLPA